MEVINNLEALVNETGDFLENKVELWRLKAIDKTSDAIGSIYSRIIVIVFAGFFLLLASIGAALWIGDELGKTYYGFFIVAGVYLLAFLLVSIFRKDWLKMPMTNMLIRKFLKS